MDGLSVIGRAVDRRDLEDQSNPTDAFDLLYVAAAAMLGFGSQSSGGDPFAGGLLIR